MYPLHWLPLPGHMINHRCKVGGAIQLDRLEAFVVGFQDALYTIAVGVVSIAVLRKRQGEMVSRLPPSLFVSFTSPIR